MIFTHPDKVTYWIPTYNTDGKEVWGTDNGLLADARVGNRSEEVVTEQGKDPQISKLAIYVDGADFDIKKNYLIAVGDFVGQTKVKGARRVLARSEILTGATEIRLLV